jgi:hypothetical protein
MLIVMIKMFTPLICALAIAYASTFQFPFAVMVLLVLENNVSYQVQTIMFIALKQMKPVWERNLVQETNSEIAIRSAVA